MQARLSGVSVLAVLQMQRRLLSSARSFALRAACVRWRIFSPPPRFELGPLSADEFACEDARTGLRAHVNMAESVHSMFRRAIIGVRHQISGKHMGLYLREGAFRWNHRGAFGGRVE